MTTEEFLDRYDNKKFFTEDELYNLWINNLFDEEEQDKIQEVREEEYGEPHRWNTPVDKVIKVDNRYFMIFCFKGNTECQDSYYDQQPEEVEPYEVTITTWRTVNNGN